MGLRGAGGVKTFSVGICNGAPSTAHSSYLLLLLRCGRVIGLIQSQLSTLMLDAILNPALVKNENMCLHHKKSDNNQCTGFIQASMSKIKGLFKDLSSLSNSFQGLKVNEKYLSKCSNSTSKMLD